MHLNVVFILYYLKKKNCIKFNAKGLAWECWNNVFRLLIKPPA